MVLLDHNMIVYGTGGRTTLGHCIAARGTREWDDIASMSYYWTVCHLMKFLAAYTGDISSRSFLFWPAAISLFALGTRHVCG
jgi:hypothetical protein